MKTKIRSLILFTLMVTLAMNGLDLAYHVFTSTAVHLNYVLVKFAIIALTIGLTSALVGISMREGFFTSVTGSVMFYLYYLFAYETIPRENFIIDENLGYVLLHAAFLLIAYYVTYYNIMQERKAWLAPESMRRIGVIVLAIVGVVYAFVPEPALRAIGLNLELTQVGTSIFGIIALVASAAFLIYNKTEEHIAREGAYALLASLAIVTADLGALMFTRIGVTLDFGAIFFTNSQYVFALVIFASTTLFMCRVLIGRSLNHSIITSVIIVAQMTIFAAYTDIAPLNVLYFVILFIVATLVQYGLNILWRHHAIYY